MFSDPAKSTRFSLPHFINSSPSGVASLIWMVMENMECDRLQDNGLLMSDSSTEKKKLNELVQQLSLYVYICKSEVHSTNIPGLLI